MIRGNFALNKCRPIEKMDENCVMTLFSSSLDDFSFDINFHRLENVGKKKSPDTFKATLNIIFEKKQTINANI